MSIKYLSAFQKPISLLLLFSILFIYSCSTENSITNSNHLEKTNSLSDINSQDHENKENTGTANLIDAIERIWEKIEPRLKNADKESQTLCLVSAAVGYFAAGRPGWTPPSEKIQQQYNFRDDYLSKSEKGNLYTKSYYLLGIYGFENNIIIENPIKHLSIIEIGFGVSKELQHGTNNNKILINKSTYDDLKELSKLYRNSENHMEIDPVLDYLETDLEKYYNKPKAEIAADFGF